MHKATHKVLDVIPLSEHTFVLEIERAGVEFKAGQCMNIGVPKTGINREYSSYSGESEPTLKFLIREVGGGQVTPRLRQLRPGDEVELDGAYGDFVIPSVGKQSFTFIASGTGIAPFHSFVKSIPDLEYRIIHGVRSGREDYDRSDYKDYVCCSSRDELGDYSGRVTDYISDDTVDFSSKFYLCGNRNMICEVYDKLRQHGVGGDQIITETFF